MGGCDMHDERDRDLDEAQQLGILYGGGFGGRGIA